MKETHAEIREDRPAQAHRPLTRQARRRLEQLAAEDAIRERFLMPRKDRRAFARLLRKVV